MEAIIQTNIAFAMSQICLSGLLFARIKRSLVLKEWIYIAFLITIAAYLLQPMLMDHWVEPYRKIIENFLPGLFWLLCSSLFNDNFKIKKWSIIIILFTVFMPAIGLLFGSDRSSLILIIFAYIPQFVEFVLLGLAMSEVIRHWQDDLIEERRDLRLWFCAITGVYITGLIVLRETVLVDDSELAVWQYVPVSIVCLVANLLLLQYRRDLFYTLESVKPIINANDESASELTNENTETEVEVPQTVVIQLDELMNKQHVYREMGLTIGQLAEKLDLPEYRLRKIINAGLGYRNFNDYLNGFRISEAGSRLSDPSFNKEAVLNIALDTGFRSLSSFNKAFREAYGLTPTAYRQQQIKTRDS